MQEQDTQNAFSTFKHPNGVLRLDKGSVTKLPDLFSEDVPVGCHCVNVSPALKMNFAAAARGTVAL